MAAMAAAATTGVSEVGAAAGSALAAASHVEAVVDSDLAAAEASAAAIRAVVALAVAAARTGAVVAVAPDLATAHGAAAGATHEGGTLPLPAHPRHRRDRHPCSAADAVRPDPLWRPVVAACSCPLYQPHLSHSAVVVAAAGSSAWARH